MTETGLNIGWSTGTWLQETFTQANFQHLFDDIFKQITEIQKITTNTQSIHFFSVVILSKGFHCT